MAITVWKKLPLRNWLAPTLLITLIGFLAQIPLILLLTSPPQGSIPLGGSPLLSPSDTNVYFAAIKQGELGNWLYTNNFTTIDNAKILIFSLYISLGHITRELGIPAALVFLLSQFFSAILLLSSIWILGSFFFSRKKQKILYFAVALFVTGYGWLILLLINKIPFLNFAKNICLGRCFSIDLWTNDATIFPLLSTVPHITLTAALMVFIVLITARYLDSKSTKTGLLVILLPTLVGLLSAYHLLVVISFNSWVIFLNLKKIKEYKALIISTILIIARAVYLYVGLHAHESFANWIEASRVASPPLPSFLIGWGGLFIAGYFGVSKLPKTKLSSMVKLISILTILLAFFPSSISRNLVLTTPVFLAIFATFGLISLSLKKTVSKLVWTVVILAVIDVFVIYLPTLSINKQLKNDPAFRLFFITTQEKETLDWLSTNSKVDEGVLASYRLGDIIPAYTGNKVFWGHWSLSGNFSNQYKYAWVIDGKNENEVLKFLADNHLNWVVAPSDSLLKDRTYLKLGFSNSDLSIYKVVAN